MVCRFVNFKQRHVCAAGDVNQNSLSTTHAGLIKEGVVDGCFCSIRRTVFTRSFASAHHGFTHFRHHRADIGEIKVDVTWLDHQISDPANTFVQDFISHCKGIGKCCPLIGKTEQVLVWNNNQCINISLQLFNTGIGLTHPDLTFKIKRLGHNTHGQDTTFTGRFGNDRGCPRACAAAHTRGDKDHMAIGQFC